LESTSHKVLAAAQRILEKQGQQAISMRRVAKAVGVTPMAIYHHFADRPALLEALADRGFAELAGVIEARRFAGRVEVRLAKMAEIFLDHALANPRLFELMFLSQRKGARRFPGDFKARKSPTANPMAEVIQEGMASGVFRRGDPWEVTFAAGALSHGLIMLYLGGRLDSSAAEFRALYRRAMRIFIRGIRS
jgi:AcrR family transcriptional regulator